MSNNTSPPPQEPPKRPPRSRKEQQPAPETTTTQTPPADHREFADGTITHNSITVDRRNNIAHIRLGKPITELQQDIYHALFGWYIPDNP